MLEFSLRPRRRARETDSSQPASPVAVGTDGLQLAHLPAEVIGHIVAFLPSRDRMQFACCSSLCCACEHNAPVNVDLFFAGHDPAGTARTCELCAIYHRRYVAGRADPCVASVTLRIESAASRIDTPVYADMLSRFEAAMHRLVSDRSRWNLRFVLYLQQPQQQQLDEVTLPVQNPEDAENAHVMEELQRVLESVVLQRLLPGTCTIAVSKSICLNFSSDNFRAAVVPLHKSLQECIENHLLDSCDEPPRELLIGLPLLLTSGTLTDAPYWTQVFSSFESLDCMVGPCSIRIRPIWPSECCFTPAALQYLWARKEPALPAAVFVSDNLSPAVPGLDFPLRVVDAVAGVPVISAELPAAAEMPRPCIGNSKIALDVDLQTVTKEPLASAALFCLQDMNTVLRDRRPAIGLAVRRLCLNSVVLPELWLLFQDSFCRGPDSTADRQRLSIPAQAAYAACAICAQASCIGQVTVVFNDGSVSGAHGEGLAAVGRFLRGSIQASRSASSAEQAARAAPAALNIVLAALHVDDLGTIMQALRRAQQSRVWRHVTINEGAGAADSGRCVDLDLTLWLDRDRVLSLHRDAFCRAAMVCRAPWTADARLFPVAQIKVGMQQISNPRLLLVRSPVSGMFVLDFCGLFQECRSSSFAAAAATAGMAGVAKRAGRFLSPGDAFAATTSLVVKNLLRHRLWPVGDWDDPTSIKVVFEEHPEHPVGGMKILLRPDATALPIPVKTLECEFPCVVLEALLAAMFLWMAAVRYDGGAHPPRSIELCCGVGRVYAATGVSETGLPSLVVMQAPSSTAHDTGWPFAEHLGSGEEVELPACVAACRRFLDQQLLILC